MSKKKSNTSSYCELCSACGSDGCCSYTECFSVLIQNPKCKHGKTYVKEAILSKKTNRMVFELVDKLEKDKSYTKEEFISDFNSKYEEFLDEYNTIED